MKYRFTVKDFEKVPNKGNYYLSLNKIVLIANTFLEKWEKESARVFGNWNDDTDSMSFDWTVGVTKEDNASAVLWNPKLIKEEK